MPVNRMEGWADGDDAMAFLANQDIGDKLWDRFSGDADGTRWYYRSLAKVFHEKLPGPLQERMARAVDGFNG